MSLGQGKNIGTVDESCLLNVWYASLEAKRSVSACSVPSMNFAARDLYSLMRRRSSPTGLSEGGPGSSFNLLSMAVSKANVSTFNWGRLSEGEVSSSSNYKSGDDEHSPNVSGKHLTQMSSQLFCAKSFSMDGAALLQMLVSK